ncbi:MULTISPECIES: hypothetical protein [unclassified Bradyrhizobium]|uniref:hypothetical protein n=1 Tax=unclassified Bradyrhizobium TaxID=2631580 RepID=UPI002915F0F9|nr:MULTISPECIES: hypothetical protein [unclassified Bradyrhizobium]
MADIASVRAEIERARKNVARLRRDILALQRAGRPTTVAEAELQLLLDRIDKLSAERDRLKGAMQHPLKGKVLGGRKW